MIGMLLNIVHGQVQKANENISQRRLTVINNNPH